MSSKKKTLPVVSIIVCVYNHEKWIVKCLESLLNQKLINYSDFEIIVVNDFSKDNTKKLLKKFNKHKNLKIINNNKNLGLPRSLNIAIKISTGKYIVRVDSDDFVSKYFVILSKLFLDTFTKYQAVEVDYVRVDEKNKILPSKNKKENIACGIMFRKKYLFKVGLYNLKFKMREGHELRKRFVKNYKIGYIKLPLYKYRMHSKNRTKSKKIHFFDKILKNNKNMII